MGRYVELCLRFLSVLNFPPAPKSLSLFSSSHTCDNCYDLLKHSMFKGIVKRLTDDVHENPAYLFHGVLDHCTN